MDNLLRQICDLLTDAEPHDLPCVRDKIDRLAALVVDGASTPRVPSGMERAATHAPSTDIAFALGRLTGALDVDAERGRRHVLSALAALRNAVLNAMFDALD